MATIPFTEEDIKGYLDGCIEHWRTKRDTDPSDTDADVEEHLKLKEMAPYYIDAFQSVRMTLFGELLPK